MKKRGEEKQGKEDLKKRKIRIIEMHSET